MEIKDTDKPKVVKEKTKANPVLVAAGVIGAITVAIAFFVADYNTRNPKTEDITTALNVVVNERVLANNTNIPQDAPVSLIAYPVEEIDGKNYWPVEIVYTEPDEEIETEIQLRELYEEADKTYGPYYVAERNSKVYTLDEQGEAVEFDFVFDDVIDGFSEKYENAEGAYAVIANVPDDLWSGFVTDENGASNVITREGILSDNDFVKYDTPTEISPYPEEDIDGIPYWRIEVYYYHVPEKDAESMTAEERSAIYNVPPERSYVYFVDVDGEIFTQDETGALVEFDGTFDDYTTGWTAEYLENYATDEQKANVQ